MNLQSASPPAYPYGSRSGNEPVNPVARLEEFTGIIYRPSSIYDQ